MLDFHFSSRTVRLLYLMFLAWFWETELIIAESPATTLCQLLLLGAWSMLDVTTFILALNQWGRSFSQFTSS